eukprot:3402209-Amphidinium_carterae.1
MASKERFLFELTPCTKGLPSTHQRQQEVPHTESHLRGLGIRVPVWLSRMHSLLHTALKHKEAPPLFPMGGRATCAFKSLVAMVNRHLLHDLCINLSWDPARTSRAKPSKPGDVTCHSQAP